MRESAGLVEAPGRNESEGRLLFGLTEVGSWRKVKSPPGAPPARLDRLSSVRRS